MATQHGVDQNLLQKLEGLLRQPVAPKQQPPMSATPRRSSIIPCMQEACLRLTLARHLQGAIRQVIGVPGWKIRAVDLAVIFIMPLDMLRKIARTGAVPDMGAIPAVVDIHLEWISELMILFFDAAQRELDHVPRVDNNGWDMLEAEKCLERENRVCLFTGWVQPHACHIMPFALNSDLKNRNRLARIIAGTRLFGDRPWSELLAEKVGSSDCAWNMLAVSPELHLWWARGRCAVKCLGITHTATPYTPGININNNNNQHVLTLEFHWMPKQSQLPRNRKICVDQDGGGGGEEGGPKMFQEITSAIGDLDRFGHTCKFSTLSGTGVHTFSPLPVVSGQIFHVRHSTKEDAQNMKDMIDLQWYLILANCFAGSADSPEEDMGGDDDMDRDEKKSDYDYEMIEIENEMESEYAMS